MNTKKDYITYLKDKVRYTKKKLAYSIKRLASAKTQSAIDYQTSKVEYNKKRLKYAKERLAKALVTKYDNWENEKVTMEDIEQSNGYCGNGIYGLDCLGKTRAEMQEELWDYVALRKYIEYEEIGFLSLAYGIENPSLLGYEDDSPSKAWLPRLREHCKHTSWPRLISY